MGPLKELDVTEVGCTHMLQKEGAAVMVEDRWEVMAT